MTDQQPQGSQGSGWTASCPRGGACRRSSTSSTTSLPVRPTWALPLVSYASGRPSRGLRGDQLRPGRVPHLPGSARPDHRQRHHPLHPQLHRPERDRAAGDRATAGTTAGGVSDSGSASSRCWGRWDPKQGAGGRCLVVPPGTAAPTAPDHRVIESDAVNIMSGFRTLDPDPERSRAWRGGADLPVWSRRGEPANPGHLT